MTEDTGAHRSGTWDSIKRSLQEGAAAVVGKAEELTQTGRARLDVAAAKARVSRLHAELGARVCGLLESGTGAAVADNPEVRVLCEQIREARDELSEGEAALEELKAELRAEAEPPPAAPETSGEPPPA